ncbi:transcript variant X1 [Nothobranchius furzeri]|uniref:Syndecan 3 n=2 Tax=Nothobranchius furzeri TaxID=105023 RepID=A0A1A8AAH6_NOTFU|nr:transcript variant X1 [Nothobranchius furzeri]
MQLLSLTASLILLLGFIHPAGALKSFDPPGDLEACGDDMEDSGSGDDPDPVIVAKPEKESKTVGVPTDRLTETFTFSSSKSFWENKEIAAGCIAGGVTGAFLGFILSAILIYIRRKKQGEGNILGRKKDENF